MLNDKSLIRYNTQASAIQRYRNSVSYTQLQTAMIAIAFTTLSAVTLPAFMVVQPAFARESIAAVERTIKANGKNSTIDALAKEIANLEIERAMQLGRFTADSPEVITIETKIQQLRDLVTQTGANHAKVNRVIADVLRTKVTSLEVEVTGFDASSIPTKEAQLLNLRHRYAQLQPAMPKLS